METNITGAAERLAYILYANFIPALIVANTICGTMLLFFAVMSEVFSNEKTDYKHLLKCLIDFCPPLAIIMWVQVCLMFLEPDSIEILKSIVSFVSNDAEKVVNVDKLRFILIVSGMILCAVSYYIAIVYNYFG
jgi:hypothetical protein